MLAHHDRPAVSWSLLIVVAFVGVSSVALCPSNGPVTVDIEAIGCANLQLRVVAENVTVVVEGATGTINVTSDANGTALRLVDSVVTGNLVFRGSSAVVDVRNSSVTGADVLLFNGARNLTLSVSDSKLTGSVVASVVVDAGADVSVAISNSALNATRFAVSFVGSSLRDATIAIVGSQLEVNGRDDVGVVALVAISVVNVTVGVATSTVVCTARSYVGVIGVGGSFDVAWTGVAIRASGVNITSMAAGTIGILGAASTKMTWVNGALSVDQVVVIMSSATDPFVAILGTSTRDATVWTNVTLSALQVRVTSIGQETVGILGAVTGNRPVAWTTVAVSSQDCTITSTAAYDVAIMGAVGNSGTLTWTDVTLNARRTNISSTAQGSNNVGIMGAAMINGGMIWTNTTVSSVRTHITSTAANVVGILGGAAGDGVVAWTNVTLFASASNISSIAGSKVGILGAACRSLPGTVSWADVALVLVDSIVVCRQTAVSGVLGLGFATRDPNSGLPVSRAYIAWRNLTLIATTSTLTVTSGETAALLAASADGGKWEAGFAAAVEANISFNRQDKGGYLLGAPGVWTDVALSNVSSVVDTNSSVVCSNQTIETCPTGEAPTRVLEMIEGIRSVCGSECGYPSTTTSTLTASQSATETLTATITSSTTTQTPISTAQLSTPTATFTSTTSAAVVESPVPNVTPGTTTTHTAATMERSTADNTPATTTTISSSTSAATMTESTAAAAAATTTTTSAPRPERSELQRQQQQVETSAAVATAALAVLASPLAANKGTTMSRVLAGRECRWGAPEPEPTQFVYVFEVGGSVAAGALISTLLLQVVVAAAAAVCARARRFPHATVLHLAVLSYFGPNVAALATATLSRGDSAITAAASLVLTAALLGVASASAWVLASHHRALWKNARDPRSPLVRVYGVVDLACAFFVGVVSGAGGLACATQGALTCAACLVNFAHAALVRPATRPLENALAATTALLVLGLALLSAAAPREPTYDRAVFALAVAVAAWMYMLLALAVADGTRRVARRCATKK